MTLQHTASQRTGEDSDDLRRWLGGLGAGPAVTMTVLLSCASPVHGDDPPTWFFVEGSSAESVARRRCLACGGVTHLLDSEEHWTGAPMCSCDSCGQSMFEVAAGLSVADGRVSWVAVGLRCVGCGRLSGLTDFVVDAAVDEVVGRL